MSLSDKLKLAAVESNNYICVVGKLLVNPTLSSADKDNLLIILNTPLGQPGSISNSELGRILRGEDYKISNSSIDRHRRGDCRCRESN